jgi:hypothetical protein
MSEKDAGQDQPEQKPDRLAEARATGKAIRDALAANMQARVGEVVEKEVIHETKDVLASILQTHLAQIVPDVKVAGIVKILPSVEKPEKIEFVLAVDGRIILSIEPGAEDDSLPEPPTT